jgi:hypothetical protein
MCCGHTEQQHHSRAVHHADVCGCGHAGSHGHGSMRGFGGCGCGGGFSHPFGPVFWSKKKQIRMLEQLLEQKREEVQDLADLLDELQQEK